MSDYRPAEKHPWRLRMNALGKGKRKTAPPSMRDAIAASFALRCPTCGKKNCIEGECGSAVNDLWRPT